MKKIIVLISIVIIIVVIVAFNHMSYTRQKNAIAKYNLEFEENYQKEIYGIDLTTIINKVINNNEKNNVEIGQYKKYEDNGTNSINIDIKMLDIDSISEEEIASVKDKIYAVYKENGGNGRVAKSTEFVLKVDEALGLS